MRFQEVSEGYNGDFLSVFLLNSSLSASADLLIPVGGSRSLFWCQRLCRFVGHCFLLSSEIPSPLHQNHIFISFLIQYLLICSVFSSVARKGLWPFCCNHQHFM